MKFEHPLDISFDREGFMSVSIKKSTSQIEVDRLKEIQIRLKNFEELQRKISEIAQGLICREITDEESEEYNSLQTILNKEKKIIDNLISKTKKH